jgi:hypothetical protein
MSGGATQESLDQAIARAESEGKTVVRPGPNQLLLDLDTEQAIRLFWLMIEDLEENFGATVVDRWTSSSGRGLHVVVQLDREVTEAEAIALQAACGSDPLREMLAIACLKNGCASPRVLFKPALVDEVKP